MIASFVVSIAAASIAATGAISAGDAPATAAAQSAVWQRGTWELGLLGGYARGKIYDAERTPIGFTQALARAAFHFGPTGRNALRGNFAVVAEGVGTWIDQDPHAGAAGLNLLVRYTWAASERWRPVAVAGAGILYSNILIPPDETRRNFTPQLGVGIQYMSDPRLAFTVEYRFHHISNKGTTETNPGINAHLVLVGFSFFH